MPKSVAIAKRGRPALNALIIANVRALEICTRGFRGPERRAKPSCTLSFCVPPVKCQGLQQSGVSHRWRTISPKRSLPILNAYAMRCAPICPNPGSQKAPYPRSVRAARHNQQELSAGRSTWLQNLPIISGVSFTLILRMIGSVTIAPTTRVNHKPLEIARTITPICEIVFALHPKPVV